MPPVLDPSKSKVDGLAFLGLSLALKSEQGHPESYTHQTSFDLNDVLDREYEFISSTDDNGWLVGGGEPGPPASYKLALKDSAHAEIIRIGNYRKEWGGVPQEEIIEVMKSGEILIPQIEVLPTAVVENHDSPPELQIRFDMEPQIPDFDDPEAPLPVNWQIRFLHNQLFKRFLFPSRFCPGPFHSTILRKAEFRSEKHREQYFAKCDAAIKAWREKGIQPLNTVPRDIDGKVIEILPAAEVEEKVAETSEASSKEQMKEKEEATDEPEESETKSEEVDEKEEEENIEAKGEKDVNESEASPEVEDNEKVAEQGAEEGAENPEENEETEESPQEKDGEKVIDDLDPSTENKAEDELEPVVESVGKTEDEKVEEEGVESDGKAEEKVKDEAVNREEKTEEEEERKEVIDEPVESEGTTEEDTDVAEKEATESQPEGEEVVETNNGSNVEDDAAVEIESKPKEDIVAKPEEDVKTTENDESDATEAAPSEEKSELKTDGLEKDKEEADTNTEEAKEEKEANTNTEEAKEEKEANTNTEEAKEEKNATKIQTAVAEECHSGIWLFTDRATITHFFQPNFLPPYNTPEKRKIIMDVLREEWDENTLMWKPCGEGSMTQKPPEEDVIEIRSGDKNMQVKLEVITKKSRGSLLDKVDMFVEGVESQLIGMCAANTTS